MDNTNKDVVWMKTTPSLKTPRPALEQSWSHVGRKLENDEIDSEPITGEYKNNSTQS